MKFLSRLVFSILLFSLAGCHKLTIPANVQAQASVAYRDGSPAVNTPIAIALIATLQKSEDAADVGGNFRNSF